MRIVVADYSGHPFQVQLSRELARRGHSVLHLHFAEFQTPKGRLTTSADDPANLIIEPISLGRPFAKHSFIRRRFQEISIGTKMAARISSFDADVVVASNLPLDPLRIVERRSLAENRAFVFWQQDIYAMAIERIMKSRWGALGGFIGKHYKGIEREILRASQAIIAISDDFVPYLSSEFGISGDDIHVVENWAPLDEIVPKPKCNPWSLANGFAHKEIVLYSGTLGLKHDANQILAIAISLRHRKETAVVVISEGPQADWLATRARELGLESLQVLGFQPFEIYSDVLGSGNVLLAILETNAGVFSVPSKILSYLCAGRSIVLSAPLENLASRIISRSGAGCVVHSGDDVELIKAVKDILDDPKRQELEGKRGRSYAQTMFDVEKIGTRFESILTAAYRKREGRPQNV